MKENSLWFRHDANASSDSRMLILRSKHGFEGMGFFWSVIELLSQNEGAMPREALLAPFSNVANAKQMLEACLTLGILKKNNGGIYSVRLMEELRRREDIFKKRRLAGRRGGLSKAKNSGVANAKQMPSKSSSKALPIREDKIREHNVSIPIGIHVHLLEKFKEITGRQNSKILLNASRKNHINARLKQFSEEEILKAWEAMAADRWLTGENDKGKNWLDLDYALRQSRIEKYLTENDTVVKKSKAVELAPVTVTRK